MENSNEVGKINLSKNDQEVVNNIHREALVIAENKFKKDHVQAIISTPRFHFLKLDTFGKHQLLKAVLELVSKGVGRAKLIEAQLTIDCFLGGEFGNPVVAEAVFHGGLLPNAIPNYVSDTADKGYSLISRDSMLLLKEALTLRMETCEEGREKGHRFDPDTYIGMKVMLLDIREALMGEVISIGEKLVEEPEQEYAH